MNDYYQVLGIQPGASLNEIKLAYRKKASRLHPDINPSPTAHEDFIALSEAYEYLLREKTGKVYNNNTNQYTSRPAGYSEEELRNQARERAKQSARMKYQEFVNSDYYKSKMSQYKTLEFWGSLILFIPFFTGQILLFAALKVEFIFSSFLLFLLTVPLFVNMIFILKKNKINQILIDTLFLIKTDAFITIMAVLFNTIIFINIGVATFIPMKIMIAIYIVIPILFQLFREFSNVFIKEKLSIKLPVFLRSLMQNISNLKRPFITIWGIFPLVFSLLIILNILFYQNKVEVTQNFDFVQEENGAMVKFEDPKYNHYWGICYFRDYDQFRNFHNRMTLKLKKGLFGVYVLESYSPAKK
jgi:hypothetical protein